MQISAQLLKETLNCIRTIDREILPINFNFDRNDLKVTILKSKKANAKKRSSNCAFFK